MRERMRENGNYIIQAISVVRCIQIFYLGDSGHHLHHPWHLQLSVRSQLRVREIARARERAEREREQEGESQVRVRARLVAAEMLLGKGKWKCTCTRWIK